MFWLRNKKINLLLHSPICRSGKKSIIWLEPSFTKMLCEIVYMGSKGSSDTMHLTGLNKQKFSAKNWNYFLTHNF